MHIYALDGLGLGANAPFCRINEYMDRDSKPLSKAVETGSGN